GDGPRLQAGGGQARGGQRGKGEARPRSQAQLQQLPSMHHVRAPVTSGRSPHGRRAQRSEEHTSELRHSQISYAVFCLKKKKMRSLQPGASVCTMQTKAKSLVLMGRAP